MAHLSEPGAKAAQVLSDGKWHPLPQLVVEVAKVYPPGLAARRVETTRLGKRNRRIQAGEKVHPTAERVKPSSTQEQIYVGQRRLAVQMLGGWVKRGLIELDGPRDQGNPWRDPSRRVRATQRLLSHKLSSGDGGPKSDPGLPKGAGDGEDASHE